MHGVKIIVCVKQIPDPEAPLGAIRVDTTRTKVDTSGPTQVISPYDENAIEAALQIKEEKGGDVTILSLGANISPTVLRKAFAVGADRVVLLEDRLFEGLESSSIAYVLSAGIKRMGAFDLLLAGRQAGDWESGHTGVLLGERLGIAGINLVRRVKIEDGHVVAEKILQDGYEMVRARLPAMVTISSEVGELRFPSMKKILLSRKQRLESWSAQDLQIDPNRLRKIGIVDLFDAPEIRRKCHVIEGISLAEKGAKLAAILKRELL